MRPLILIWIAMLACAESSIAQHNAHRVESDINKQEREADVMAKRRRDIEHMNDRIAVTYEKNPMGEIVFTGHNNTFSNYVIELSFSDLQNLRSEATLPYRIDVPPGTRRILTLQTVTKGVSTHFAYHFHSFKGCMSPAVDSASAYLLPVSPGSQTQIDELNYFGNAFAGEPQPKDWYALRFHVHNGDTIFAARRGRVTLTRDTVNLQDSGYAYVKSGNFVEIQHSDCTYGRYTIFRLKGVFVQPGDWVEAGQPLGLAGGESYTTGPQVQFEVYYYLNQEQQQPQPEEDSVKTYTSRRAFVPLKFWVKDQGPIRLANHSVYACEHPAAVITKEMSKKEARKYTENHKSS